jgi:hypothetical protein
VQPELAWSPLTKDFGAINVGSSSSDQTFTLTNSGGSTATGCSAPTIDDTTNFTIATDNCGTSDLAGSNATCTVLIHANPGTTGVKTATLSRACTWGGTATTTTNQIVVTGVEPSLAWSPLTKDFGKVNVGSNSSTQTFTLTNSGSGTASGCSAPSLSNSTDFSITTDNCGTADLAGSAATCTVLVRANPASAGALSTTLSRTCTVGGSPSTTANQIIVTGLEAFTENWPFDFGSDASYTFDSSKIDFTGGVARLTGTDQTDDDNTASGFGGGILSGASWDATNGYLRLAQTGSPTNRAELDPSWTPNYANILGYWKLDGSGSIADAATIPAAIGTAGTTKNPNGTGMSYSTGKINQGINFDGVDDEISSYNPGISFTDDTFTVTGWFKANAGSSGTDGLFGTIQWDPSYATLNLTAIYIGSDDSLGFQSEDTTLNILAFSGGSVRDGKWHHFAVIRDKANSTDSIYVDTLLVASAADTRTGNFNLASSPSVIQYGHDPGNKFDGQLDEVTLWNGALSPSDLAKIYDRQFAKYSGTVTSRVMDALSTGLSWTTLSWKPTLPFQKELPDYSGGSIQNETSTDYGAIATNTLMNGIVGLWHLDETSGTTGAGSVKDASGQSNNGTPNSTMIFGADGILGKTPSFDGTATGSIEVANNANLSFDTSQSFTLQAWIKTSVGSIGSSAKILVKRDTASSTGAYTLQLAQNKYPELELEGAGALTGAYDSSLDVRDGKWHHIVAVVDRSAGYAYLYRDGVLRGSTAVTANLSTTAPLGIGSWTNAPADYNEEFNGSIDEVAIWSRALSAAEILQLYRRGTNRIKYQARVCSAADCSDDATGANWKGPDGTNQTYFSELDNRSGQSATPSGTVLATLPAMLFSNFTSPFGTSRYFQYRAILESDDVGTGCNYGSGATWCSPELKSVTVDPTHYDSSAPSLIGKTGVAYDSLSNLVETLGAACPSGIGYNLGIGASSGTATWYWWDSTANSGAGGWVAASGASAQSNPAAAIATNLAAFSTELGTGTVYFKAYLKSSGSSACELDNLALSGIH